MFGGGWMGSIGGGLSGLLLRLDGVRLLSRVWNSRVEWVEEDFLWFMIWYWMPMVFWFAACMAYGLHCGL